MWKDNVEEGARRRCLSSLFRLSHEQNHATRWRPLRDLSDKPYKDNNNELLGVVIFGVDEFIENKSGKTTMHPSKASWTNTHPKSQTDKRHSYYNLRPYIYASDTSTGSKEHSSVKPSKRSRYGERLKATCKIMTIEPTKRRSHAWGAIRCARRSSSEGVTWNVLIKMKINQISDLLPLYYASKKTLAN